MQETFLAVAERKKIACVWEAGEYRYQRNAFFYTQKKGAEKHIKCDSVLCAVGRVPNYEELALEAADVAATAAGITIDESCRTSQSHIFAIGDVTPAGGLTHIANAQGRQVVQQLLVPLLGAPQLQSISQAIFIEPQLAVVGIPAADALEGVNKGTLLRYSVALQETDRGKTDAIEHGFITIFAHRLTGRIAHVTIMADGAGEMIPFFSLCIDAGISLWKVRTVIFPYPTLLQAARQIADAFVIETLQNLQRELTQTFSLWLQTFFSKHWQKLLAVLVWLVCIVSAQVYLRTTGVSIPEFVSSLVSILSSAWYGPILYAVLYIVRSAVLFPASILTALAGAVWGVQLGTLYAVISGTLASLVPYSLGRWFGSKQQQLPPALRKFERLLTANGFESTITLRLLYVPFDAASFILGFSQVAFWPYLVATVLGSIFATLTFVSVGAAINLTELSAGMFSVKAQTVFQSLALAVAAIVCSRVGKYFLTRYRHDQKAHAPRKESTQS